MTQLQVIPGANEINTFLLVVGLPTVAWVGRKLIKSIDSLDNTVTRLSVTLLGTEGQGGLVRRVEGIARQGHEHSGEIMSMKADLEGIKERLEKR